MSITHIDKVLISPEDEDFLSLLSLYHYCTVHDSSKETINIHQKQYSQNTTLSMNHYDLRKELKGLIMLQDSIQWYICNTL